MGSDNSSQETKDRAALLANEIGATHFNLNISDIFNSFKKTAFNVFNNEPKFLTEGGTN